MKRHTYDPNYKLDDAAWARIDARIAAVLRSAKDQYETFKRDAKDDRLLHKCMDTLTACLEDDWPYERAVDEAQRQGVPLLDVKPSYTHARIEKVLAAMPTDSYAIYDPRVHKLLATVLNTYSMRKLKITAQVAQVFGDKLTMGVIIKI